MKQSRPAWIKVPPTLNRLSGLAIDAPWQACHSNVLQATSHPVHCQGCTEWSAAWWGWQTVHGELWHILHRRHKTQEHCHVSTSQEKGLGAHSSDDHLLSVIAEPQHCVFACAWNNECSRKGNICKKWIRLPLYFQFNSIGQKHWKWKRQWNQLPGLWWTIHFSLDQDTHLALQVNLPSDMDSEKQNTLDQLQSYSSSSPGLNCSISLPPVYPMRIQRDFHCSTFLHITLITNCEVG